MLAPIGTDITQVDTVAQYALGARIVYPDGKEYRYYLYDNGDAISCVAGDVAVFVLPGATTVTCDNSAGGSTALGAGVAQATVGDGEYGWFQTKGLATLSTAIGGTEAAGQPLTCAGAADKAVTAAVEGDMAAAYKSVIAYAVAASGTVVICAFP